MSSNNQTIWSSDQEYLKRLEEEYQRIGRDTQRFHDKLVVYALPRKKQKKDKESRKETRPRGERRDQKPKERH